MEPLVEIKNLSIRFPEGNSTFEAVKGISFSIGKGEIVGVVGESGSGKSMSALALMGLYLFWIRTPKIIFKPRGFFFANVWIEYQRIKEMNLSEDGVLVMQLEQRRLLIRVRNIDDLEKIYKLLITTQ